MISHRTQWKYGSKSTAVASIATLHGSRQASPLKGVSDFVELAGNKVTQLFLLFSYALLMLNPLQNKVFTASQIGCRILCCCEGYHKKQDWSLSVLVVHISFVDPYKLWMTRYSRMCRKYYLLLKIG